MQVTADDLENMMADIVYNKTLRNQFLELRDGTSDDWIVNEETMRRQLICDWVHKNTPKIMNQWVPTSAVTRRCLGEVHFDMSSTGVYTPSVTCSGHGVCQPDPWLPYAGVCECYRGYEHRDCSILSEGEVVNIQLYHPTNPTKAIIAEYWFFGSLGLMGILVMLMNWTAYYRDTPIFDKLGSAHSFILLVSGCVTLSSYPFWVLLPNRETCTFKWSIVCWGISMIVGINGIKMNFVLNQVRYMPRDRPERLANVDSKALLRSTLKLSAPVLALATVLYLSNPISTYDRIPNMIWLKRDICEFNFIGQGALYGMLFYVVLQWCSAVVLTYQVICWNLTNAYYGSCLKDWLYIKETYFITFTILFEGGLIGGTVFSHLWVTSYPTCCNSPLDPHLSLNQTCNVLKEEEKGIYVHSFILISFSVTPVLINYIPKIFVMCCCPLVNDMRHRYTRRKYPEELLSEKVIQLNREVSVLEDALDGHQQDNLVMKVEFNHRLNNLKSQLTVTKTALAKSVPSIDRFLRALGLSQYIEAMQSNGLTVKKLIEIRGDVGRCEDPAIIMLPGHLRKMQRGLYNIARVMKFNFKYEERNDEKEKRKMEERREKKRMKEEKALAKKTEVEAAVVVVERSISANQNEVIDTRIEEDLDNVNGATLKAYWADHDGDDKCDPDVDPDPGADPDADGGGGGKDDGDGDGDDDDDDRNDDGNDDGEYSSKENDSMNLHTSSESERRKGNEKTSAESHTSSAAVDVRSKGSVNENAEMVTSGENGLLFLVGIGSYIKDLVAEKIDEFVAIPTMVSKSSTCTTEQAPVSKHETIMTDVDLDDGSSEKKTTETETDTEAKTEMKQQRRHQSNNNQEEEEVAEEREAEMENVEESDDSDSDDDLPMFGQ